MNFYFYFYLEQMSQNFIAILRENCIMEPPWRKEQDLANTRNRVHGNPHKLHVLPTTQHGKMNLSIYYKHPK